MIFSEDLIAAIVLISIMVSYLISTVADALNISHLSPELPGAFSDVYDAGRYETSQQYLKETTRLGLVSATVDMAALLMFWFSGAFGILDLIVRELSRSSVVAGLLSIGALAGLKFLLSLPFSIWRTFVIEEKYGFNKTTAGVFVADLIKTALLSIVLGSVLLSAVIWFFNACGPLAWLYCWGATTLFLLAVQYIVPTWIMPLFNRFTPLKKEN